MEKWKTIEPGLWKPKKAGDNIIGFLVNKEPKNDQAMLSARYYLETMEECFSRGAALFLMTGFNM